MKFVLLATAFTLLPSVASAQYGFTAGITGMASQVVTACGFDCSDPANSVSMIVVGNDQLTYQLQGDVGSLAGVLIGLLPTLPICPGIDIPGISNSLLMDPVALLPYVPSTPALSSIPLSNCGAFGATRILNRFTLPASLSGSVVSFQGLVFENGIPLFTRPLDIVIT